MTENTTMLILGILLIPIGIMNIKGNISSIHLYNRTKITEETRPKYGKFMGIGTLIIAGGLILTAILNMLFKAIIAAISSTITLITVVIGIAFMLYAQFKYNYGIF